MPKKPHTITFLFGDRIASFHSFLWWGRKCGWVGKLQEVVLLTIEMTFWRRTNRGLIMLPEKQARTARFENFSIAGLDPPRVDDIPCFEGVA